jgi:hypothetical protein
MEGFESEFTDLVANTSSATFEDHAEMITGLLRIFESSTNNCNLQKHAFYYLLTYFVLNDHRELPMGLEAFKAAIKNMENNPNDCDIQTECCQLLMLVRLRYAIERQDPCAMDASVRLILRAMGYHDGSDRAQEAAISTLAIILDRHQPCINAVIELGGICLVVKVMRLRPKNWHIQRRGCDCLSFFARENHIEQLWCEQALPIVMKAMKLFLRHPDSAAEAGVHDENLGEEIEMAYLFCYSFVDRMYDKRAAYCPGVPDMKVILDVIPTHMQHPKLLGSAAWAMQKAIYNGHPDNKKIFASTRCVKMLVDGMKLHPSDANVQGGALCALHGIIHNDDADLRQYTRKLIGLEFMLKTMRAHEEDMLVQRNAALILELLMQGDKQEKIDEFIRRGGVRLVLKAMCRFKDDERTQHYGIRALSASMTCRKQSIKQHLLAEGVLEAMLTGMERHPVAKDTMLTASYLSIMRHFMEGCQGEKEKARICRVIQTVIKAMAMNPDDEYVHSQAHDTLRIFLPERFSKHEIASADGIPVIVASMNRFPDCLVLQRRACVALDKAAFKHIANQNRCLETGAMDAVLRAFDRFEEYLDLVDDARDAILSITFDNEANTEHAMSIITLRQAKKMTKYAVELAIDKNCLRTDDATRRRFRPAAQHYVKQSKDDVFAHMVKLHEERIRTAVCANCGKNAALAGLERLLQCNACTIAPFYCGIECQKACWGAHKAECKANRKK